MKWEIKIGKIRCIILLMSFSCSIPEPVKGQKFMEDRPVLNTEVFSILNLQNAYLCAGIDFKLTGFLRQELGLGVILPMDLWSGNKEYDLGMKNGKGLLIKVVPKIIFYKGKGCNIFVSPNLALWQSKYTVFRATDDMVSDIVSFEVSRKMLDYNLQLGVSTNGRIHDTYAEIIIGVGMKNHFVKNTLDGPESDLSRIYYRHEYLVPEEDGIYRRLNIPITIKAGRILFWD
ncbi:MAG: hypothetical protein KDC49_05460 [Saprospiraceae bacterium]|nr:hypothetical protein [Saprospiraceae bacterium]